MGEVRVGDQVIGADGRPTTVVAATEVMTGRPCYEVHFSDGSVIVADAQHQWLTETRASRGPPSRRSVQPVPQPATFAEVRTTEELARTVRCATKDARLNHSVTNAAPLQLPAADLPIAPYTLGVWLGDGTSAAAHYTSADPEIAVYIEAEGLVVVPTAVDRRYALRLPARTGWPSGRVRCAVRLFTPQHLAGADLRQDLWRAAAGQWRRRPAGRLPGLRRALRRAARSARTAATTTARSRPGCARSACSGDKHIPPSYLRASERPASRPAGRPPRHRRHRRPRAAASSSR